MGNVKNLTQGRSPDENKQQELSQPQIQSVPDQRTIPSGPPSITKNPYNEFDIGTHRDITNPEEYNQQEFNKGRQNRQYDEFNIGPMSRDFKDDFRLSGPSNRIQDKSKFILIHICP